MGQRIESPLYKKYPSVHKNYIFGLWMRLFGTTAYWVFAFYVSGGNVDAFVYYRYANLFTERFLSGDFSPLYNPAIWRNGQFFHTNFVSYPASFFQIITFDNRFGIYLLFSLVCFTGLSMMLKGFLQYYTYPDYKKLSFFVFMFPAVWFWTSTIGKDAFMFLGLAFIVQGLSTQRIKYTWLVIGVFIIYAFRPPVALIVCLCLGLTFAFSIKDSLLVRGFKIVLGLGILLFIFNYISANYEVEVLDAESVAEFQNKHLRNNNYGGSKLEQKSGGLASIPRGMVDILMRPFLWEINNFSSLLASLEINLMLFLVYRNFSVVKRFVKNAFKDNLSKFILSFVVLFAAITGLVENNLGLIARHRSILFPLVFAMVFHYSKKQHMAYLLKRKKQLV